MERVGRPGWWDGGGQATGQQRRWWHVGMGAWLIYLGFGAFDLVSSTPFSPRVAAQLALLAVFVAGYVYLIWRAPTAPQLPQPGAALAVMTATALVLIAGFDADFILLLLFVNVGVAIVLGPERRAVVVAAGVVVLALVLSLRAGRPPEAVALNTFQTAVGALAAIGFRRVVRLNAELRGAREDLARMAVTEERLRFARDLHDLLGHSLSLIVLKSELAEQLVTVDPAQAAVEVAELRTVARRSLAEVREAVSGYRRVGLAAELAGARAALETGGIDATVEALPGGLPAAVEEVLGWAVREGVTNVLRHSRASACQVRFERAPALVRLEISDDGAGPGGAAGGSGLAGLGERVAALGGTLSSGPAAPGDGPGFRLRVELPVSTEEARA